MSKTILQLIFLLLVGVTLFAQNESIKPIDLVEGKRATTVFQSVNPFSIEMNRQSIGLPQEIQNYTLLNVEEASLKSIKSSQASAITMTVPMKGQSDVVIDLVEVNIFAEGFRVYEAPNMNYIKYQNAKHYRGIVQGSQSSAVAISIFEDQVMGLITSDRIQGNLVIGKLNNTDTHIIYKDADIMDKMPFECGTDDSFKPFQQEDLEELAGERALSDCVRLYLEVDYDIYQDKGSTFATADYITGLFNQVSTMYANENINTSLSPLVIWTQTSPYSGNSSSDLLNDFTAYRQGFDGDLAQLLSYQASGGIAYVDGLCSSNPDFSMGFSSINSSYANVPAYSWSVMVVTHEFGHLFGSQHTHACVWNGNGTAIDGCFTTEGGCADPGNPSGGGTVMSYCHLTSVGINLNLGFGPQPGNVIRNNVTAANCLSACDDGGGDDGGGDDCVENEVTLTIKTDNYPGETTWTITDANGNTLYSGGPYTSTNSIYTIDICEPDGCYDFTINDSYGDGICCAYGQGYYNIIDANGEELVEGGVFTFVETQNFCLGDEDDGGNDPDADGDGVADDVDNCVNTPNANQTDGDSDGVGDVCDNCPGASNSDQADSDGNGVGDECEPTESDCITVNFNDTPIVSYGGNQDQGTATILNNGETVRLNNNAWKAILLDYEVTENTIISFDFGSTKQGEIHGIGFDNNNSISGNRTFRLFGTQNWGISAYDNYTNVGYWTSYSIPVGDFYQGEFNRIFFVMDHDAQPKDGNSYFTNIQVFEGNSCALLEARDGKIESDISAIFTDVNVFPNPATDEVNINYTSLKESSTTIEMYSITVLRVYASSLMSNAGNNQITINVDDFNNGTFLLRIQTEESKPVVRKIQIIRK